MATQQRILIIGGGYAGIHAAKKLEKRFRRNQDVAITLVDKSFYHTLMTELHEIAGDRVPDASVRISYKRVFSGKNINVAHDEIIDVDFSNNVAVGRVSRYEYDYLLIATGGKPAFFNIPGVEENALTLWSLDDAMAIRRHIDNAFRQASFESVEQKRRSLLTIAVAGGGFTGVELVGELIEFIPVLCQRYEIDRDEVRLLNIEALGSILQMLPDKDRSKAVGYMEKKGVEILTNALITQAEPGSFSLKDGRTIEAGTLVWTCGIKGNCMESCNDLTEGKAGRKQVEASMKSPDQENVFLAGDGIWFLEDGAPVPQIVEAAEQTAAVAAHNIALLVDRDQGKRDEVEFKSFRSNFHGYMVSIGSKYAVSHTAGMSLSGFPAMALKHVVNMYYQAGVAGLNAVWAYLKHEILDIRHGRSLVGGFAAWRSPNYWLVPLRMYLGVMWIIEGAKKIGQGWLNRANDFVSVNVVDGVAAASEAWGAVEETVETVVDSTAAASGVMEETATQVADAVAAASGAMAEAAGEAVAYATPLIAQPTGLYTWMAETFVNRVPYLFQSGIVIFEILIGLAFVGGAFTFVSAGASILFGVMLILGAMTDASIFWYMFAALALMGGAGRSFGLDYWIMPFCKKLWNRTGLAKKTYLYTGEPSFGKKKRK